MARNLVSYEDIGVPRRRGLAAGGATAGSQIFGDFTDFAATAAAELAGNDDRERKAMEDSWLAETAVDVELAADDLAREHETDPGKFTAAFASRAGALTAGAPSDAARAEIDREVRRVAAKTAGRIELQANARAREADEAGLRGAIDHNLDRFKAAVRAGDPKEAAMYRNRYDGAVETGLAKGYFTGAQAAAFAETRRAAGEDNAVLGEFERALGNGATSARKAIPGLLADVADPDDRDRLKRRMEAELAPIEARETEMQTRRDVLDYIRASGTFSNAAQSELERVQTEGDLTRDETLGEYQKFLAAERDRLIADSGLGDEAKAKLTQSIEEQRLKFSGAAGRLATQAQRKLVNDTLGSSINALTAEALDRPDDLPALFRRLDDTVDTLAPSLSPEEEMAFRDLGRRELALNAVEANLSRGNHRAARALIDSSPGIVASLPPEDQRRIIGALNDAEHAEFRARREAADKLAAAEWIKGAPLTLSERLDLAGLAPRSGEPSLSAKIADMETVLRRPLSPAEKQKALGLDAAAAAQTEAGKRIQDREMFARQFGADSEQVRAFDEASKTDAGDAKLSDVAGLRKEFTAAAKDFVAIRDSFSRIAATARNPSPAGDLALMFNYMKMLDPGSVVRESEFAQVAATGSWGERLQGAAIRFLSGERLTEEQRTDFLARSEDLMRAAGTSQLHLEEQFRGVAEREGVAADQVVIDFLGPYRDRVAVKPAAGKAAPQAGPKPGEAAAAGKGGEGKRRIRIDLEGNVIQ